MKNLKIYFQLFIVSTVIWFSSMGCVTKQVWTDKMKVRQYDERIISFYSNMEKNEVVFIGQKYHYILNQNTEDFMHLLKARKLLNLSAQNLQVRTTVSRADKREIGAYLKVYFKQEAVTPEQEEWLKKNHYRLMQHDGYFNENKIYNPNEAYVVSYYYIKDYNIHGTRYVANSEVNQKVVMLKKPMDIKVEEYYKSDEKSTLYKVAMTPLSVTADAGLIVVGVGAAIIYAPFFLTYMAYEEIKGK